MIDQIVQIGLPIGTFVAGFAVSRFTMSLTDKKAFEQKIHENGQQFRREKEERAAKFTQTLQAYLQGELEPSITTFYKISTTGDLYFSSLRSVAAAILDDKIPDDMRDNVFVPDIVGALQKSIPAYYRNLQKISQTLGCEYSGEIDGPNYRSMIKVAVQYGKASKEDLEKMLIPAADQPVS